jgi:basic amino acid/polyamine antiporter, APA family
MNLFVKKPIDAILSEAGAAGENTPKRHLSGTGLIFLGIGAIIGSGLFVRTAEAAAFHAGSGVVFSFVIAATGCALAGLCYAEFAAMIPVAGSAYTYAYATLGQLIAWIIGWDLVLEYALGAATVSISWSEYLNKLIVQLFGADWEIPYAWCHSPFQTSINGESGVANLPALAILAILTLILIRGISQSAVFNAVMVAVKLSVVLIFIVLGWKFIRPENHDPFIPVATTVLDAEGVIRPFGGWSGVLAGAGIVFFAFIGFDAVSTVAQETKNPKRDMPFGILGSLAICTVLYILFGYVLTGIAPYTDFRTAGKEASVTYVIQHYMKDENLALFVTLAILFGLSSVILVMLLGQSRVFYSMSRDGLVPKIFSRLHPVFRTPWRSNLVFLLFTGLFAAFIPSNTVGDMTNIGTLFAFALVCVGIVILRKKSPDTPRPFKTPFVPWLPALGVVICITLMLSLGWANWARLLCWQMLGLFVYFTYGRSRAKSW